jgi:hypothetical protein
MEAHKVSYTVAMVLSYIVGGGLLLSAIESV